MSFGANTFGYSTFGYDSSNVISWTLLLMHTPFTTSSGSGQITELTAAHNVSMTFSLTDGDTISFTMPSAGQFLAQTQAVIPGQTDVMVFRDSVAVQRFLVTSASYSNNETTFTAQSYKSQLARWIIHDDATRNFVNVEQTAIAWTLISEAEARANEQWNLTLGSTPVTSVYVDKRGGLAKAVIANQALTSNVATLITAANHNFVVGNSVTVAGCGVPFDGTFTVTSAAANSKTFQYAVVNADIVAVNSPDAAFAQSIPNTVYGYDAGTPVLDAVKGLAEASGGFDWDITPDPASPLTSLKFNTWNLGLRTQFSLGLTPIRANLTLDYGGTLIGWSAEINMADFTNVIRVIGQQPTQNNDSFMTGLVPAPVAWSPTSKNPVTDLYGRYERSATTDDSLLAGAQLSADGQLALAVTPQPTVSATLRRGRWTPAQLWLGDLARVIVSEGPYFIDADMRVQSITIALTDGGSEDVTMTVGKYTQPYLVQRNDILTRIANLERRP